MDWYRPLTRLLESAPRETRGSPGALRTWLAGRQRAGVLPADDLRYASRPALGVQSADDLLTDNPRVYENYLSDRVPTDITARSPWSSGDRVQGRTQYDREDLHQPGGTNYREVVVRSPELLSARTGHFSQVPGGRRIERPMDSRGPDDVLGWLRMQDYHPTWSADGDRGAAAPYTWVDELQSDRFGDLRQRQRELASWERNRGAPASAWSPGLVSDRIDETRQAVTDATRNLSPWTNSWDALLFRRALQEAALQPNNQGLAWTSGMMQAQRYAGQSPGQYASLYDQRLPRLARAEARRLQLPEDTVGTGSAPHTYFETDALDNVSAPGQPIRYPQRMGVEYELENMLEGPDLDAAMNSIREVNTQVPYHYFNLNDDSRRALERYGLPYFGRGGRV